MEITLIPTLDVLRDIYRMPRDMARFQRYRREMAAPDGTILLPISGFNPMGHDHVAEALDHLLSIDAERVAANAIADAASRLARVEGTYRVALVLSDDIGGMWTERTNVEATMRFRSTPRGGHGSSMAGWIIPILWTGDGSDAARVAIEVRAEIYRAVALLSVTETRTLDEIMRVEGRALRFGGASPVLNAATIEAARASIAPHRGSNAWPMIVAAMFGDETASMYGYDAIGVPPRAGFDVALADALAERETPEAFVR